MLAQLVLEIRRRASAMGADTPRALALQVAANDVLESREDDTAALPRRILAALLGMDGGGGFDAAVLDAMTPNVIVLLDIILIAVTREQVAASVH